MRTLGWQGIYTAPAADLLPGGSVLSGVNEMKPRWVSWRTARVLAALTGTLAAAWLGAAAGSGLGTIGAGADRSTTFVDPAGDSQGAPDVTAVGVSYTEATGMVSVGVTAANPASRALAITPEVTPPPTTVTTDMITVSLDTDTNSSTGGLGGYEYRFEARRSTNPLSWDVSAWDGATMKSIKTSSISPIAFSNSGSGYTWTISKADLAGATRFAFVVTAGRFVSSTSGSKVTSDRAPDSGSWTFDPSPPPPPPTAAPAVKPLIGTPAATPSRAIAGKRFSVAFRVTRSDNGAPVNGATMVCDPSIAGKIVPHRESFAAGTARISFTVPKTARHKVVKVKLTVKSGSESTARTAAFRVG